MVGVNRYQDDDGVSPPIMRIDPAGGARPGGPTAGVPGRARPRGVGGGHGPPRGEPPRAPRTCVPALIDAVKAGGTLGEVSDRLRDAWGEHRELVTV